jgi:hypothetical protein
MGLPAGVLILMICASLVHPAAGFARQQSPGGTDTRVRIVQGLAGVGPVDIYIDGSLALIGIIFGEASGELSLEGGDHEFAVTPTGAATDEALVAGTIRLREGSAYYATLFGTADEASVGLFTIDERPLDVGRARFRVISGVPDIAGIVPAFTGGEALTEPLGFGDASEYAALDAGIYDLDLLDAASGAVILSLPGTLFAEGTATDVILIGLAGDATMTALVSPVAVELTRPTGRVARIVEGTCSNPGDVVADLGVVRTGQGESVGAANTRAVAQGYGLAAFPFARLVAAPHAVVVTEDEAAPGTPVACGAIGGSLTDAGALVIALEGSGSAPAHGIAVLAPGVENPETTGVSVFLAGAVPTEPVPATPVASNG